MSSAGKVSKVFAGPLTSIGEEQRLTEGDKTASPSLFETIREVEGTIYKVNDESSSDEKGKKGGKLLVKVYETNDGSVVANDQWVPLAHFPQEIADRFGTIRPGMRVKVSFQGPSGLNARATIIGNEKEKVGEEEFNLNELETGLFEIFKPGM